MGKEISRKKKKTTKTDDEIEAITTISRAKHEDRNGICNELPTGKLQIKPGQTDTMLYVDDAGREWRRNPDLMASYHQPMSMPNALFHSIIDAVIFCVDFPVPNMKFISINADQVRGCPLFLPFCCCCCCCIYLLHMNQSTRTSLLNNYERTLFQISI